MKFHPVVEELFEEFTKEKNLTVTTDVVESSRAISTLAVIYEKARNAIEYRAEHFVRRAAVERILKRRVVTDRSAKKVAENLVVELLWAKYIDSSFLGSEVQEKIKAIVERYLLLRRQAGSDKKLNGTWDLLLGVMASEIDELIVKPSKREALLKYFYLAVRPKVAMLETSEEDLDMFVYVSCEKALVQADEKLITYHLLRMSQPEWFTYKEVSEDTTSKLLHALSYIREKLKDGKVAKIYPFVRNQLPAILLLRDYLFENGGNSYVIAQDSDALTKALKKSITKANGLSKSKLRRAIFRSLIYIFLTKMLFAFALELPYDIYIAKDIQLLPLLVNLIFPLILLIGLSVMFRLPGKGNAERLISQVQLGIYDFDKFSTQGNFFAGTEQAKKSNLATFFYLIYLAGFVVTFGLINAFLSRLHFNLVSKAIFVFFVALVTFFAYHIRVSVKEYEVVKKHGIIASLLDFFFLPILRAGQILSGGIAKLNMLVFVFDFILEAPLKTIFEVMEEWFRFIRTKREEII